MNRMMIGGEKVYNTVVLIAEMLNGCKTDTLTKCQPNINTELCRMIFFIQNKLKCAKVFSLSIRYKNPLLPLELMPISCFQ